MPRYEFNEEHQGIEIYFDSVPSRETLAALRKNRWRWFNAKKCWYTTRSDDAISFAKKICSEVPPVLEEETENISPLETQQHAFSVENFEKEWSTSGRSFASRKIERTPEILSRYETEKIYDKINTISTIEKEPDKLYTQAEILNLMRAYDQANRKTVTLNLIFLYKKLGIKNKDVIEKTGYSPYKVNSWTALSSPNIPTFEDALLLATTYHFNVDDLIKPE